MSPFDYNAGRQMEPRGLAGGTMAPSNVESDLPPGSEGTYAGGPLANPPPTSPTPAPQSLTTLANGGNNHQEAWMQGQASPVSLPKQAPFSASQEQDLPPGAEGTFYGGPLSNPPKPTPAPKSLSPDAIAHFTWASAFDEKPVGY